ncbi:MAG: type II toxin-antitoxin system RelE/ParE family toxin [Clostridia bacterium]|nr:type II toxin-antitoxin system RelE/ParE family toxin [Clostridia bacterium]NCC75806.1 type II toxin-antitoxin system RelE/ParE family toxin [Clostridia bacterium]
MYEIKFSTAAEKYFKKLKEKPLLKAYKDAIIRISRDPYIGEKKHGDLNGVYGYDVHYSGVNYELAYLIYEQDDKKVVVLLAGTRENFYDQLKRYLK